MAASTRTPNAASPFLNRELSWLEFNQRVLDEALNPEVPLIERVKFFCITYSNLDEFFEVRVSGLKQQIEADTPVRSADGLNAPETFKALTSRVRRLVELAAASWREKLLPALEKNGVRILHPNQLSAEDQTWLDGYYRTDVHAVLTPLSIDPAHPFPQLLNKSLNLITRLTYSKGNQMIHRLAVVQVPRVLPFLVRLPRESGQRDYVQLEDLIAVKLGELFPDTSLEGPWAFRVTRNSELYIDEEEISNLLKAVENELRNRRKGEAVRLEVSAACPPDVRRELLTTLGLTSDDLYVVNGPVNPTRLMELCEGHHQPELHDVPFVAPHVPAVDAEDLFRRIRERDQMFHHPYESFEKVIEFLTLAASDPKVLAIKQTLYRTGGDRRIVGALMEAVKNGKQVTVVVELKARFDEANNIAWGRRLEEAGVHVVYGVVGYKIHCKALMVVRAEEKGLRRYVHLGTGNYNASTARLYTDISYFSANPDLGEDVAMLFNLLTGVCQYQDMKRLWMAPFDLKNRVLELIRRETRHAKEGLPARIIAKMNSLVDEDVIRALYTAAEAGAEIDLIVRGICCLRPGVGPAGHRIRVRSIVDRFLEHSRIWYFENSLQPELFIASADWMPRNFYKRIEIAVPILDGRLRDRLIAEVLAVSLSDNVKARYLKPDGTYAPAEPHKGGKKSVRSQAEFVRLATATATPLNGNGATPGARPRITVRTQPKP
ncbi:MAG TPA: polyphosphate kinase 1 [Candidatus Limnocylindria bacterium]|nr:polyphosphate kinase 1 [Candidatus Limnocylindria bacterium]